MFVNYEIYTGCFRSVSYVYVSKIIRFDLRLICYGGYSRLQGFYWCITFLFTFLTNQSADNARFNHNNCFIKEYLRTSIFPIFLKIFVDFFPDYMKAFHHKYARLLGFNDLTQTVAASTLS